MAQNLKLFLAAFTLAALAIAGPTWAQGSSAAPIASPHAYLGVSAPTDAEVHQLGNWYRAHIPLRYRATQSVSVNMLSPQDMIIFLESGDNGLHVDSDDGLVDGVFQNDPPNITLRLSSEGVPNMLTFAHEFGHYLWFDELSNNDRARYGEIYTHQKAAHRLITAYASFDVQEGFAEAFSYFIALPSDLKAHDPLSYHFFETWPGPKH